MNNNNFNTTSTRPPSSGNGSPGTWTPSHSSSVGPSRPPSLMDQQHSHLNVVRVVVTRDGGGYGMKVSGDNPVYVQSVKEGGPAEKAGLHAGDKIMQVNGANVMHSTHTDVVGLIKAHAQVVLTVQQRNSPLRSQSSRPASLPLNTRITAPRPVDNEKQHQLQQEREQYYLLMIEKEQHHLVKLQGEVANSPNEKKRQELIKVEKNLRTLQDNLARTLSEAAASAKHHRTKSNPECLVSTTDGGSEPRRPGTPPGTPPPPYPSPEPNRTPRMGDSFDGTFDSIMCSPNEPFSDQEHSSTPHIRAANSRVAQQTIISMEDDDISDLDIEQVEDHGYFKSLARLWEHLPHLAVFMNYVLSNADPNSLLFYLLTDLYKEGNAKEMRKWAFEIHSCFLVPGAPLRLNNVDENIAREIDEDLTKEYEKEEIMRKIFWKARQRAKEELTRQLADFQQKRTAGLGTIYGPTDQELMDHYNDKAKEAKLYESLFVPKVELYLEEIEKEHCDPQKYYLAAALITILTRVFKILKSSQNCDLDRVPTFVNKERSFKAKLVDKYLGGYHLPWRKLSHLSHQFVAQQYFTVMSCYYCHQIIYGICPQGYQCTACNINLHQNCVKQYEDYCPGPFKAKEGRISKFIAMRRENSDQSRQKKVSQFIQNEREKRQQEEKESLLEASEIGESKVSQPVSRSGSDRRPDSVREEGVRPANDSGSAQQTDGSADNQAAPVEKKEAAMSQESSANSHSGGAKRRHAAHINRSESVKEQSDKSRNKQRRNVSDPSHSINANYGGESEQQADLSQKTDSGSSSNSSISGVNGQLSESPSNSMDVHQATVRTQSDLDSDMDGETDPLNWQELVTEEELKKLNPKEKKRQEVINELFQTEASHVRMLRVLYKLFYRSIDKSQLLKPDEINLIFPNIEELYNVHTEINKEMRRLRKEDPLVRQIGDMLLSIFTGPQGELLQKAAATFCERQQMALEFIKKRRERDNKFDSLLSDCEKKRECRRLQLQGIVPYEMQRLTRYALLLERLIESVEAAEKTCSDYKDELVKLRQAHHCSKEVLGFVNEATKLAHNKHRLEEIQRHLDVSNFRSSDLQIVNDFRNIDLTRYKLVLEGGLQLRRPNKPPVQVHVLLMEEIVVILQKESDRFILKFFQTGSAAQPPLSPIIKMNTLLARENAVCKNALFLVNTSTTNSQMYDLCAEDEVKRETWLKHFSEASDTYNRREGKPIRPPAAPIVLQPHESDSDNESVQSPVTTEAVAAPEKEEEERAPSEMPEQKKTDVEDPGAGGDNSPGVILDETNGGGIHITSKVSAEEWPLIQPSQVNVQVPPVHVAESMLTPLEQIRRKDALVKQTLAEKEDLVADLLAIPREHFEHIADMASMTVESNPTENHSSSDIVDRLLASVFQVDILQKAVNEALNVTEGDVIASRGGKTTTCLTQEASGSAPETTRSVIPSVPAKLVGDIAASLSLQLNTLLIEIRQVEEDRDKLRKELHNVREKLHEENNLHNPVPLEKSTVSDENAQEVFCEASDEPF
ncbi:rho guanine nucleotide exchange factor 12 isoform X6 [Euwallacea similis]|uniref:rho guanine nucleotide exchange factor 12 isoform X6 n=1 Tax=Euwallacea similis TaxID=1736056 RepID=UPI00344EF2D7